MPPDTAGTIECHVPAGSVDERHSASHCASYSIVEVEAHTVHCAPQPVVVHDKLIAEVVKDGTEGVDGGVVGCCCGA